MMRSEGLCAFTQAVPRATVMSRIANSTVPQRSTRTLPVSVCIVEKPQVTDEIPDKTALQHDGRRDKCQKDKARQIVQRQDSGGAAARKLPAEATRIKTI